MKRIAFRRKIFVLPSRSFRLVFQNISRNIFQRLACKNVGITAAVVCVVLSAGPALAASDNPLVNSPVKEFLATKTGQYAIILLFFFIIIGILRFLLGPGGPLREAKWDEWNEQARKDREAKEAAWQEEYRKRREQKERDKQNARRNS